MIHRYSPRITTRLLTALMFTKTLSLLFSLLLICATSLSAQTIRYVSTMGANADPATANSWANSTANLQAAINSLSATGGEVWVAAGTYKPTTSTDRTISFSLRNGVTIYGGFPTSGNPGLAERSPASFTTTLSGDIGVVGSIDDNSYHVIYNPASLSLTTTAILDGVVVTAGNANGTSGYYGAAGAMLNDGSNGSICSPTVRNCSFINNAGVGGGGVYNFAYYKGTSSPIFTNCNFINNSSTYGFGGMQNNGGNYADIGTCSPILTNCIFSDNFAKSGGGGMYNLNSNPQLINCSFINNFTSFLGEGSGGGVNNENSRPLLINCSFANNGAFYSGGGMYSYDSFPVLINCSFTGNGVNFGDGSAFWSNESSQSQLINCSFTNNKAVAGTFAIHSDGPVQLTNCILWNNGGNKTFYGTGHTVSYSLLEPGVSGYTDGTHNLTTTTSPFVSDTDLRLKAGALAINTGGTTAYSAASGPASDLGGSTRIQGLIDMGAYESSFVPDVIPILYTLPSTQYGTSTFSVVVDVFELNSVPTQGLVTVYITKDPLVSLNFNGASTTVGDRDVQNGSWTFDGVSNDNAYILTSTQAIEATGKKSFGLTGIGTPGNSKGSLTITTAIANINGEEVKVTNNNDADKIDYFKQ